MTTTTTEQSAAELAGHQGFAIISNEKLRQLYLSMVKCRLLAERLQNRAGETAPEHEAVAAGIISALLPGDAAAPSCVAVRFLQGELQGKPLEELLSHDAESDLASQLKLTLRAAQAGKKAGKGQIAVVFQEGNSGFGKALKQASAKRLPVIFVRQNSVLSESFGAQADGVPVIPVDGADVVAVYRVATESITHARKGNGPTLIECYFDPSEVHDPILKMEAYLTRQGLFREAWKQEEAASFRRKLNAALRAANR